MSMNAAESKGLKKGSRVYWLALQGGQGGVGRERAYLQDINVRQRDDAGDALQSGPILLVRSTRWSWLKAWAMQIARRRGMRKAIVALARRLAVIIHRISVEI
jgi:hypothetical protein